MKSNALNPLENGNPAMPRPMPCLATQTIKRAGWLQPGRRRLGLLLALATLAGIGLGPGNTARAQQPFVFTTPAAGAVLCTGQPVTITWTGGAPSWSVNLSLINVSTWSVAAVVATGLSNTGSYAWNLPANLPCPGTYQFYIEDTQATTWTYGPSVTIDCCPTGCFQPPSGMVGWWPLDDATNQSTVLDLAANHQGTARDLANNIVNIGPPPVWSLPDPAVFGGSLLPVVTDPNTSNPPRGALFLSGQGLVEVPHHPSLNIGSNGMTLTLWTWPTPGSGGPQPLVEKYDLASAGGYSLYLDPVGSGNFVLKFLLNGTVVSGPLVPASVSSSDWRFVVARVSGAGNVTLSVCDAFGACTTAPPVVVANFITTNTAPLWFGKSAAVNPGAVTLAVRVGFDEIELFDRGLAQTEIQQIYDGEKNGTRKCVAPAGAAEVCIYKFEDTNGNGQPDPGENGLPGWQFTVSPAPCHPPPAR